MLVSLRTSMSPGESWCNHDENNFNNYNNSNNSSFDINEAIKLDCYDHTENAMCGRIYLDLFWRPTKITRRRCFCCTISTSCRRWTSSCPLSLLSHHSHDLLLVIHIYCHMAVWKPYFMSSVMQHNIYSVVIKYQHLSGARGELDFVELPSILFEHFIWDYRVLKHFAQHYQASPHHTIPQQMVHNLSGF